MEDRRIQASYLQIDKGIFANTITATGDLIASGNFQSSGTGIFSALDLNNIDNLTLSGVDVAIIDGNVTLTNDLYLQDSLLLQVEEGRPKISGRLALTLQNQGESHITLEYEDGDKIYLSAPLIYNNSNDIRMSSRPFVNGTGVLLSGDIPYVQTNSYFYVDATRKDSYIENGNILYPYKTLSSAYNAAKNIASFHNPTYITLLSPIAENLTIDKGYINLVGNNTNKNDPIRITGSLVFAATGIGSTITDNNFSIAGLGITATSNNKCILFSGNKPQRLFIQDCWLIAKDNGTCLYSNNTNTTSRLQGDILKLSPEGVNTTAIDIVSGTSSISFAETSSSASVLAYVRNNSTLNISNSQIETSGAKAFQVQDAARLTLLNSVLTNTAYPSTGIFLTNAGSTAVVVGSAISVPANANSYAINGVLNSYLFYKNLYFSIDAFGGSTESKIGNNVNKNLINSYDPVVYSIGDQTISGVKTFASSPTVNGTGFLLSGQNSFTIFMQVTNSNPTNDTISYFNGIPGGPSIVIDNKKFQIGEKCIAKKASWHQYLDTFTGIPNQNATGYFINVTTQSTGIISTTINATTFGTSGFSYVGQITPNIAVDETDYVVCGLKWGNYTLGSRPSGWRVAANIYCYN
jgi:hypothetical protein